jgi:hypothetical protein
MRKLFVPIALCALSSLSFGGVYSINDGTPEDSIGLNQTVANIYWSTSFTVTAGNETINSISGMFGFNTGTFATNGTPLTVTLSRDANHDGIADASGVVSNLVSTITGANTNTFQVYDIPDFTFAVGDGFVASFMLLAGPTNSFPATMDSTAPVAGRNWIAFDTLPIDPNNLAAVPAGNKGFIESFGLASNWMINVNASPVPEPASMAVLGMGALALIRRRNKKA